MAADAHACCTATTTAADTDAVSKSPANKFTDGLPSFGEGLAPKSTQNSELTPLKRLGSTGCGRRPSGIFLQRRRQTYTLGGPSALGGPSEESSATLTLQAPSPSQLVKPEALPEAVRQEIANAVAQERRARRSEVAELHALFKSLQEQIPCAIHRGSEASGLALGGDSDCAKNSVGSNSLQELEKELCAEREGRCVQQAEIHARITREQADLACAMEQQRALLANEIVTTQRRIDEQRSALERALSKERQEQEQEYLELRAILDAVWHRAILAPNGDDCSSSGHGSSPGQQRLFAYPEGETKEFVGDPEDIFTLYDMVREALSDSLHLQKEISDEREERLTAVTLLVRRLERTEVRIGALQSLLRAIAPAAFNPDGFGIKPVPPPATPVAVPIGGTGKVDPEAAVAFSQSSSSRTISALAAEDPTWKRLLQDPDQLFSPDDIIDKEYRKYLADVLALMVKHDCTFKHAVGLSTAAANQASTVTEPGQELQLPDTASQEEAVVSVSPEAPSLSGEESGRQPVSRPSCSPRQEVGQEPPEQSSGQAAEAQAVHAVSVREPINGSPEAVAAAVPEKNGS